MKILTMLATAALGAGLAKSSFAAPVPGGDFEQGLSEWDMKMDYEMSSAVPEAARGGTYGLRITDESKTKGSGITSLPIEVEPGKKYEVSFWARRVSGAGGAGIYLNFADAYEKLLRKPKAFAVSPDSGEWKRHAFVEAAPADSAVVSIWIHSFATDQGVMDFDDFEIREVPEG